MNSEQPTRSIRIENSFKFLWNENIIVLLLVLTTFCVYMTTMSRSVGFTDSGELASVVHSLGIAHPTGYPLLTLIGKVWSLVPLPMELIEKLNIFCALIVAVSAGLFFKTSVAIHRCEKLFRLKLRTQKPVILSSAIGGLTLAFSTTFWSQSTNFEVYALHIGLVILAIWMFIAGIEEQLAEPNLLSRRFIFFAFVLGLSFGNHMTTILLAPGFLWLYFYAFRINRNSLNRILKISPFFLAGISVYLYLVIRSAGNPLFDWGHPATWDRFLRHISGKQFQIWMFSGSEVAEKQFDYFLKIFPLEFNWIAIFFMALGIIQLLKQSRKLLVFIAVLFISTILYSINYDIIDIRSYFLLCYISGGFILVQGIIYLVKWSEFKNRLIRISSIIIIISAPALQIILNHSEADESKNLLPKEFVEASFAHFDSNAVVLATEWDYFVSPSFYYQSVQKVRTDLTIIDKNLLQDRSWYFIQLERYSPWLMNKIRVKADIFLVQLDKFERGLPFDRAAIQESWQNLLADIIDKSIPDHPVYIDARIDQEFPPFYQRIPAGLFLRLTKGENPGDYSSAIAQFSPYNRTNPVARDFEKYYATILIRDADWLIRSGRIEEARMVLSEIKRIDPANIIANWLIGRLPKGG